MNVVGEESTDIQRSEMETQTDVEDVHKDDAITTATATGISAVLTTNTETLTKKTTLESEYLYLITKHLKSIEAYANIGCQLESIINEQGVLGQSYNWDGSSRPACIRDLDKKFGSSEP